MICKECGKNTATVHTVRVVNGIRSESHLCAACAAKHGAYAGGWGNTGGLLGSLFGMGSMGVLTQQMLASCGTCGTTIENFQQTGLLGCPDCYETFAGQIIPVLEHAHGTAEHVPEECAPKEEKSELDQLRQRMADAVKREDFEEAAQLRDAIRAMEKGEGE